MEAVARQVEAVIRTVPGTTSAYAERVTGGYFLNIVPDRGTLARYGVTIDDVQEAIAMALGGETVTTTVEGRERYCVNVRYPREFRSDPRGHRLATCWSTVRRAARCRLAQLAEDRAHPGRRPRSAPRMPSSRSMSTSISAAATSAGYVAEAQQAVEPTRSSFPPGYYAAWSGQFEYLERAKARLQDGRAGDAADDLPAALSEFPAV